MVKGNSEELTQFWVVAQLKLRSTFIQDFGALSCQLGNWTPVWALENCRFQSSRHLKVIVFRALSTWTSHFWTNATIMLFNAVFNGCVCRMQQRAPWSRALCPILSRGWVLCIWVRGWHHPYLEDSKWERGNRRGWLRWRWSKSDKGPSWWSCEEGARLPHRTRRWPPVPIAEGPDVACVFLLHDEGSKICSRESHLLERIVVPEDFERLLGE